MAIWERTNLANLAENIQPTLPRATLILTKGTAPIRTTARHPSAALRFPDLARLLQRGLDRTTECNECNLTYCLFGPLFLED